MKSILPILALFLFAISPCASTHAEGEILPKAVLAQLKTPLYPMGSTIYRKFGFRVYRITFWTSDGTWNKQKPYALELRYLRDISKDTLVDTVTDDLREENVASKEVVDGWNKTLNAILSDVKEGDTITSLYFPNRDRSPLFQNDKTILLTPDKAFIRAFFDILLGPTADEDMRDQLLLKQ